MRWRRPGSVVFVMLLSSAPARGQGQAAEPAVTQAQPTGGLWTLDLQAGYRAQGVSAYRGIYLAPGVWYEFRPGLELGLFAPLHLRTSSVGRVGIEYSLGVEPRFRFALTDNLRGEVQVGLAAENEDQVQGVSSYGAGIQLRDIINLRITHERYSLGPNFDTNMAGQTSANYLDLAFTGRTGRTVAYAEILVLLVLASVTSGAR